jgi:hypothetical protein
MPDPFGLRRDDDLDLDEELEEGRLGTRARLLLGVSTVLVVVATATAGAGGLLVSLSVLAGVTAVVLPLTLPGAAPVRSTRPAGPAVDNAPYRAYRQVAEQLSWAAVSPRHYDLVTRPLLSRLAAARLADRHRVDLWSEPERARTVLGDDVWPWVDPAREPSRDSQPPGVGPDTLTRIVERLENL